MLAAGSAARGQAFLTKEEALRVCFPEPMRIEQRTVFLSEQQVRRIQDRARTKVTSKLVTYFVGFDSTGLRGFAFLETQIVRTMPQTLLVFLSPQAHIESVELVAFHEPLDYRPPQRWLELFRQRALDDDLWLKRGVHNIAGATITARTTVTTLRRVLATCETVVVRED